jgi:hypothetical protein
MVRTCVECPGTRETNKDAGLVQAKRCSGFPKSIKLYGENSEGMLEFAYSSQRSIQRDIENERVGHSGVD